MVRRPYLAQGRPERLVAKTRRASHSRPWAGPGRASHAARQRARLGGEAEMAARSRLAQEVRRLPARFNAIARSSTCSGMAHLAAHDGAMAGEDAGRPCHLSAAG